MAINMKLAAVGLIGATMISLGGVGIASAASQGSTNASASASTNANVGTSGIPRSVFKTDLLDSTAKVLNTTTANVLSAHKNHTFKTLLQNAGLTRKQFAQDLRKELTSDLEGQGYSSQQVTIALQHRVINHFRHEEKHEHSQK